MDLFSKNRLLLRLVLILLLLNLISNGYLWLHRNPGDKNHPPPRDIEKVAAGLKEKLHLSDGQVEELKKIREDFFQKEQVLNKLIRSQRDSMNVEMFSTNADTLKLRNIARRLADNEFNMEMYRIGQSLKLRQLCNYEQLKEFQNLTIEIRDYFQPGKKNEEPPKRKD